MCIRDRRRVHGAQLKMDAINNESFRVSVTFGPTIGDAAKSFFRLRLTSLEDQVAAQLQRVRNATNNDYNPENELVILTKLASTDKAAQFKDALTKFLTEGDSQIPPLIMLRGMFASETFKLRTIDGPDGTIAFVINCGEMVEPLIGALSLFMLDGTTAQLNLQSLKTWSDVTERRLANETPASALLKSLQFEVKIERNAELFEKVAELVSNFAPHLAQFLLALKCLKKFNTDLKFASTDEIPEELRPYVHESGKVVDGLSLGSEAEKIKAIAACITGDIEFLFTVENLFAKSLSISTPGLVDYINKFNKGPSEGQEQVSWYYELVSFSSQTWKV
eukprot:TRINITY_DN2761_c0_g1_i1.p1 TRINITY_DN2761_c0_g1~~TRINITY_DN2761_c0_g1_i1.p1  ORF type:complete len:335 (-),score=87.51 TRINITY_DN2761_c0_g1_i1:207-1211(-)